MKFKGIQSVTLWRVGKKLSDEQLGALVIAFNRRLKNPYSTEELKQETEGRVAQKDWWLHKKRRVLVSVAIVVERFILESGDIRLARKVWRKTVRETRSS